MLCLASQRVRPFTMLSVIRVLRSYVI
jgi:hypothetical protein